MISRSGYLRSVWCAACAVIGLAGCDTSPSLSRDAGSEGQDARMAGIDSGSGPDGSQWSPSQLSWDDCGKDLREIAARPTPRHEISRFYTGVATDLLAVGDSLYFRTESDIVRVPASGGDPAVIMAHQRVGAFTSDGREMFWAEEVAADSEVLWGALLDGSNKRRLAGAASVRDLLLVGDYVVWNDTEALHAVKRADGTSKLLSAKFRSFGGWAAHEGKIYLNGNPSSIVGTNLYELPLDGSGPVLVLEGLLGARGLMSAGGSLFWAQNESIRRYAPGAAASTVLTPQHMAQALAVIGGYLYWQEYGECSGNNVLRVDVGGRARPELVLATHTPLQTRAASGKYLFIAVEPWPTESESPGIFRIHPAD